VPLRLAFLFDYSAPRALERPEIRAEAEAARPVVDALVDELVNGAPPVDREAFRALAARVRERTGLKGKSLFHPIRLVLTGEAEGLELDLAVPAIERGSALDPSGIRPIPSAADRAVAFQGVLAGP
jgi:hypothetical protein